MVIGLGEFPVGHLAGNQGPRPLYRNPAWPFLTASGGWRGCQAKVSVPIQGAYDSLWRVTPRTTAWCHYKHRLHSDHIDASRWRPSSKNQLATWHLHVGPNPGVLVDADAVGAYRASRNYGKTHAVRLHVSKLIRTIQKTSKNLFHMGSGVRDQ